MSILALTPRASSRWIRALGILGLALAVEYLLGSLIASPGVGVGRSDLDALSQWRHGGGLRDLQSDRTHLIKPAWILFLSLFFRDGSTPGGLRLFLILNVIAILAAVAIGAAVLVKRGKPLAACILLAFFLLDLPLRDASDNLSSEPLAFALGFAVLAGILAGFRRTWLHAALGGGALVVSLIRPNVGLLVFGTGLVLVLARSAPYRARNALAYGAAFAAGIALCAVLGRATNMPLNPVGPESTRVLLFGTEDYYWAADRDAWPQGKTPTETARMQRALAISRWKGFFSGWNADKTRSLVWRLTHGILGCDQLPARIDRPAFQRLDHSVRRWWWLLAIVLFSAAGGYAVSGSRVAWLPIAVTGVLVAQALAYGSDPRFALPIVPFVALLLVAIGPPIRSTGRFVAGALLAGLPLLAAVFAVPETASGDYAVLHAGDRVEQFIGRRRFSGAGSQVSLHVRLLQSPQRFALGLECTVGRSAVLRADPNGGLYPAYLTIPVSGGDLADARILGAVLGCRVLGSGPALVYFPVQAPVFGAVASVNGSPLLASGFGGSARGGLPVWTHAGID